MDLWSPDNKDTPRFTLFISDNDNAQVLLKKTCGCFIIPFGKELQYCYQQQRVMQQVGMSRLVIVRLNSGHKFGTLKEVSEELNQVMQDLIPKGCTNIPCPFFTDGDEIGYKKIVFEFQDGYVEDIAEFRRLVLKSNLDQVQS